MKVLHCIAFILLVVGGINIGLTAVGYNVLEMVLGAGSTLANIIYVLIGLSAIYEVVSHRGNCKNCTATA